MTFGLKKIKSAVIVSALAVACVLPISAKDRNGNSPYMNNENGPCNSIHGNSSRNGQRGQGKMFMGSCYAGKIISYDENTSTLVLEDAAENSVTIKIRNAGTVTVDNRSSRGTLKSYDEAKKVLTLEDEKGNIIAVTLTDDSRVIFNCDGAQNNSAGTISGQRS